MYFSNTLATIAGQVTESAKWGNHISVMFLRSYNAPVMTGTHPDVRHHLGCRACVT